MTDLLVRDRDPSKMHGCDAVMTGPGGLAIDLSKLHAIA